MDKIKVIIADDSDFVRDGMKIILEVDDDFQVLGSAANGREAIDIAGNGRNRSYKGNRKPWAWKGADTYYL